MSHDHQDHNLDITDAACIHDMLVGSGYSEKAVRYFLERRYMKSLENADHVTELTGNCGDTMKIFLKLENDIITDLSYQVLGCPGAIASAMAAVELTKGKRLKEARHLKDGDVFKVLENLPDQKQHCIRLAVKTLHKAIDEVMGKNGQMKKGNVHAVI
jgi:nitrogen fixation NifU-like protein